MIFNNMWLSSKTASLSFCLAGFVALVRTVPLNAGDFALDTPHADAAVFTRSNDYQSNIDKDLKQHLSSKASIVHFSSAAPRWSDYHAPQPGTVVNIFEEKDVLETVNNQPRI